MNLEKQEWERTVVTTVTEPVFVLSLTEQEAQALLEIIARVGTWSGEYSHGKRGKIQEVAESIGSALRSYGFDFTPGTAKPGNHSTYFFHEDYTPTPEEASARL